MFDILELGLACTIHLVEVMNTLLVYSVSSNLVLPVLRLVEVMITLLVYSVSSNLVSAVLHLVEEMNTLLVYSVLVMFVYQVSRQGSLLGFLLCGSDGMGLEAGGLLGYNLLTNLLLRSTILLLPSTL